MRKVIIIGSGGAAAELTFYIEDNNRKVDLGKRIEIQGYIDYAEAIDKHWKKYDFKAPVLCDIDSFSPVYDVEVLLAIGNVSVRLEMIDKLIKKRANIGSFIHHTVIKPESPNWGIGNIFFPHCIIEHNAIIGDLNFITSYSVISHDCILGNNNFMSTTVIGGTVKIGDNNYFGIRSAVIPFVEIGNNNLIQAGMIVNKSVKDDTTVFYRYKEQVLAIPKTS